MNDLLVRLGIESWKPALAMLLLPPVPMLLLILLGAWMLRRRALGWLPLAAGVLALWAVCTPAGSHWLVARLTQPPAALGADEVRALRDAPGTAIVVLGAGIYPEALEYGAAVLKPLSAQRLRYGVWLARRTGLPLAFSGGRGHHARSGPSEAEVAAATLAEDHGMVLRWAETRSRDTHENAVHSVALLHEAGITRIVLVTNGFHMRRALAAFERAAARQGVPMQLVAAPTGTRPERPLEGGDLLPDPEAYRLSWIAMHEWLGRLAGA